MKKLVFVLSFAILAVSVALIIIVTKNKSEVTSALKPTENHKFSFPANGVTLDGLTCDGLASQANTWVTNFVNDNVSNETKTAIWVSKVWLDQVVIYLKQENATASEDAYGIRIYFAKSDSNPNDNSNTIVIASTQNGKQDYFVHNTDFTAFLAKVKANRQAYITEDHTGNDKGALFLDDNYNCSGSQPCAPTPGNNIDCPTAHQWVMNFEHPSRQSQGVNTESETFNYSFIEGLDQELNPSTLPAGVVPDGFRIYFAKNASTHKHLFIIVPTQANGNNLDKSPSHRDNFSCFASAHLLGPNDNGEQCPDNCSGVTLPQPQ